MTGSGGDAEIAERLLARVDAEPAFGGELTRAYAGRHDVLDALWWRAHPGTETPGGLNDPLIDLDVVAQRAFARGATTADLDALRSARSLIARDGAALDSAVSAVSAVSGADRAAEAVENDDRLFPSGAADPAASVVAEHADAQTASRRVGRGLRGIVAGVAIVGLTLACGYLAYRLGDSEERFSPGVPVGGVDPLARFDVERGVADQLDTPLPREYDPATVRRLVRDEPGLIIDYSLFGARTEDRDVCLLMVFPDEGIASSCVSVPEFRRNGIELSTNVLRPSAVAEGSMVPVAHTVTWQSDDSLLFASSRAEGP